MTAQSRKINIIADAYIPYLKGVLDDVANMTYLPPKEIDNESVKYADALIIRTRCKCNAALLHDSNVKFIATATIGCDHIDAEYCKAAGIEWVNAPGCNSNSVANYIYDAISYALNYGVRAEYLGIIGVGHVGSKVCEVGKKLRLKPLLNDPPRQKAEDSEMFVSIEEIQEKADIISVHVPLQADTHHLINGDFIKNCKTGALIINSARGEVADTAALLQADNPLVIDCWENEPDINRELLSKCLLGTPHIAGYSADGKAAGTTAAVKAVCEFFGIQKQVNIVPPAAAAPYDITTDSNALKANPEKFEWFRNNYGIRRDQFQF